MICSFFLLLCFMKILFYLYILFQSCVSINYFWFRISKFSRILCLVCLNMLYVMVGKYLLHFVYINKNKMFLYNPFVLVAISAPWLFQKISSSHCSEDISRDIIVSTKSQLWYLRWNWKITILWLNTRLRNLLRFPQDRHTYSLYITIIRHW